MLQQLKQRYELVVNRIDAIKTELNFLETEVGCLEELIGVYEHRKYDPIEAERKHTDALIKAIQTTTPKPPKEPKRRIQSRRNTGYYETITDLLNEDNKALTLGEIARELSSLYGNKIKQAHIQGQMLRWAEQGLFRQVTATRGNKEVTLYASNVQV